MDFFDKLGKKASEAYKMTADKTGKIAKETKLKFKMNELKSQISELYEEIGKRVYEKHIREEEYSIEEYLEEQCTKIDVISDEIERLLKECLELKDQKQCPNCDTKIDKEDNYCPHCGEKQEEIIYEGEILEDIETTQAEEDDDIDEPIIIENNNEQVENREQEEDKNNQSNLEKTVAIESDVERYDEEDDEKNENEEDKE